MIIVSSSEISALYSLLYKLSSFTMNALSPKLLIMFYPTLTLMGNGHIHNFSFVTSSTNIVIEPRQLTGTSNENRRVLVRLGGECFIEHDLMEKLSLISDCILQ